MMALLIVCTLVVITLVSTKHPLTTSGDGQISGHPGSTGWRPITHEANIDGININIHHVIIAYGRIYVVYSTHTDGTDDSWTHMTTKQITSGTTSAQPVEDYMVATNGSESVRIADLGPSVLNREIYNMDLAMLDTNESLTYLSVDVVLDETPETIDRNVSIMTHPDAVNLFYGEYSVIGPRGTTFGILSSRAIQAEDLPRYFMINPSGEIVEITFDDLVAFIVEHRQ